VVRGRHVTALVPEAAGVLLEVRPLDPDRPALPLVLDLQAPPVADGGPVLRELEVLRQVGVVVVLPVEPRPLGDVGVERHPDPDRGLDGGLVHDRERTREAEADGTGARVRLVGGVGRAAAEQLRVGGQLDVDLQTDDDDVVVHGVGRRRGCRPLAHVAASVVPDANPVGPIGCCRGGAGHGGRSPPSGGPD
jgi:hypothetical protein